MGFQSPCVDFEVKCADVDGGQVTDPTACHLSDGGGTWAARQEDTTEGGAQVLLYPGLISVEELATELNSDTNIPDSLACWDACVSEFPSTLWAVYISDLEGSDGECHCSDSAGVTLADYPLPATVIARDARCA